LISKLKILRYHCLSAISSRYETWIFKQRNRTLNYPLFCSYLCLKKSIHLITLPKWFKISCWINQRMHTLFQFLKAYFTERPTDFSHKKNFCEVFIHTKICAFQISNLDLRKVLLSTHQLSFEIGLISFLQKSIQFNIS